LNFKYLVLINLYALLFIGCGGIFYNNINSNYAFYNTEYISLNSSVKDKSIISLTYLNKINNKYYTDGDYFLVNIYINNYNGTIDEKEFYLRGFNIKYKDKYATFVKVVDKNEYIKYPFLNKWSHSLLFRFDKIDQKEIKLDIVYNYNKKKTVIFFN